MEENNKQNIFAGFVPQQTDQANIQIQIQNDSQTQKKQRNLKKGKTINGLAKSYFCKEEFSGFEIPLLQKCKSTQEDCFKNITKEELRSTVFTYLNKLIQNPSFLKEQIQYLDFESLSKSLSMHHSILNGSSLMNSIKLQNSFLGYSSGRPLHYIKSMSKSISIQQLCLKKRNMQNSTKMQQSQNQKDNSIIQEGECESQRYYEETVQKNQKSLVLNRQNVSIILKQEQQNYQANIQTSILLEQNNNSDKNCSLVFSEINIQVFSSQLFSLGKSQISNESQKFLVMLNEYKHEFSLQFIQNVFDDPDPFLMNLSLCLLMKFLHFTELSLNKNTICPILALSTMVSYKIFYDLPIQGLLQFFSQVLSLQPQQLIYLQRQYLDKIKYQTMISNQQYHKMLAMVLKQQTKALCK